MPEPKTRLSGDIKVKVCKVSAHGLDLFIQQFDSMAAAYSWARKAKWAEPTDLKFIEVRTKVSVMHFDPTALSSEEQTVQDNQRAQEQRLARLAQMSDAELAELNRGHDTWY
jgi:hypothetical protein